MGRRKGLIKDTDAIDKMTLQKDIFSNIKQKIIKNKLFVSVGIILIFLIFFTLIYLSNWPLLVTI